GEVLSLLPALAAWLEAWGASLAAAGLSPSQAAAFAAAASEFWLYLVDTLARFSEHPDFEVRSAATSALQRAAVSGEGLGVLPAALERGLAGRVLPQLEALAKRAARSGARGAMPKADATAADLVRVATKMVLLYSPQLAALPGFGALWAQR
ncbi:hypothetical protein Rsub_13410, partial [Raphidocelis subcapitata]